MRRTRSLEADPAADAVADTGEAASAETSRATLLFVRHGENEANLTHQMSHRVVDLSLTDRGRRQADAVAAHLAAGHEGAIDAVFSSPLRRAQETAAAIADALGIGVSVLEGLREINVGALDGRTDAEAWAIHDEINAGWVTGENARAFPDGEDLPTLVARFRTAVTAVMRQVAGGRGVVVGHAGIFRIGFANVFQGPSAEPVLDPIGNASIIEVRATTDGERVDGRVIGWARAEHLADLD